VEVEERYLALPMPHENATFHIKASMLRMDEIVVQTPLKDLKHIQLVLTWMSSRALHKLQFSIDHEMQSREHKNLVEIQKATKQREALEKEYEKAKSETQKEMEHKNELECRVGEIFMKIPNTME